MKIHTSLVLIGLLAPQIFAQGKQNASTTNSNIRPSGEITLKFQRTIEIPEIERLNDAGILEIFPGDTIHLEFQDVDGELVQPKVVAQVTDPKRTITFNMTQDESMTMLSRTTEIQKTIAVDCAHRGLGSDEFFPTVLQPTEKGLSSFDSWPNSVWVIRLSNIEVTSRSASDVYEEKVSKQHPDESDSEQGAAANP